MLDSSNSFLIMDSVQTLWLMASIYLLWILILTSPSTAFLHDQESSSTMSSTGGQRNKPICKNNGSYTIGLCYCPEQYYGFRCQHKKLKRPCASIKHMQWAKVGCHLCRCFDTHIVCSSNVYSGCDDQPVKEDIDLNDYQDEDIHLFPIDWEAIAKDYSFSYDSEYTISKDSEDETIDSSCATVTTFSKQYYMVLSFGLVLSLFSWFWNFSKDTQYPS